MKNSSFKMWSKRLALCLVCVIALSGCREKVQNATEGFYRYSERTDTVQPVDSFHYTNKDTVFGHFRGKGLDTLLVEHVDSMSWKLCDKSGRMVPLTVDNALMLFIVSEGDLDGNGTEEIGIRREQEMGNWQDYSVYTYRNGKWMYLIPTITLYRTHFYEDLNQGQDVVKSTKKKSYVQVHYSLFDDVALLLDTIVKVNPIPVNSCDSIPFMKIKRQ
ncbi:MAG: hypothetical protein J5630_02010 [Bacteroidaceae bacterium]|nr:hypothetical protein [Bacteroidaceae bacterium]